MRRAFTLIELLVAVALGVVIMSAGATALRFATQATATAYRLSLENDLIAAATLMALDEVDTWRAYDDPLNATRQPLRSTAVPHGSNPFRDLAFDPRFAQHHRRAWCRLPGVIVREDQRRFGDYAALSHIGCSDPDPALAGDRAWLATQQQRINDTLGHYALLDYLPSNALYGYFAANRDAPDEFLLPEMRDPASAPRLITRTMGAWHQFHGLGHVTESAAIGITADGRNEDGVSFIAAGINRGAFAEWGNRGDRWELTDLNARCTATRGLLTLRPAHWPQATVSMRRMIFVSRFVNLVQVLVVSPIDGRSIKTHFSATGTSLRGARQQRGLDRHLGATP